MPKYVLHINLTYKRIKNNDNYENMNDSSLTIYIFIKNHLQHDCASDFNYNTYLD